MLRYFIKRLLWMIPIILAVAVTVFTLMIFCPGDPAEIILGSEATQEALDAKRQELGLNDPYFVRLGRFLSDTFIHFDLGVSWKTGIPIGQSIIERLPRTMLLSGITLILPSVWEYLWEYWLP